MARKKKKPEWQFERRTGRFIKETLSKYGRLSISDLHKFYKDGIRTLNAGRERGTRVRPPTYHSFYKYFRHCKTLGLVQPSGEEDTEDIQSPEGMGFVERIDGELYVHEGAVKRLWELTSKGISEVEAWDDPMKALGYYPRE